MPDPLSEVISLLKPRAVFTKGISGAGRWGVRYSAFGHPSFCTVVEGRCRLAVDGQDALVLEAGDFVLLPTTPGFTLSGFEPVTPQLIDPNIAAAAEGEIRHGSPDGDPSARLLGGYFMFDSDDTGLLVSLLPAQVHVRGAERLSTLVRLVSEEAREQRAGRDLVLARLVEVVLVEALRSTQRPDAPPGLLRGLSDARLAIHRRDRTQHCREPPIALLEIQSIPELMIADPSLQRVHDDLARYAQGGNGLGGPLALVA